MKRGTGVMAMFFAAVVVAGSAGFSGDADAKRLGGGTSSGMSRSDSVVRRESTPPTAAPRPATPATAAAPQPARSGMWGMLGGLALGVGLGALLSHFGMGAEFGGLMMMLLLAFGAFMLFKMFTRRAQAAPVQYAGAGAPVGPPSRVEPTGGGSTSVSTEPSIPAGFDVEGFLRQAKLNFVRLQAANDAGDLDDIRQFTSPEMFAEIQLQYQERGRASQRTDVVQLDARLLDLTQEERRYVSSVRFSGLIRETEGAAPVSIEEVWHLAKPIDGSSGWALAGIQQLN
jgi:predicted lipid-binding transport protein (Tim44 family)